MADQTNTGNQPCENGNISFTSDDEIPSQYFSETQDSEATDMLPKGNGKEERLTDFRDKIETKPIGPRKEREEDDSDIQVEVEPLRPLSYTVSETPPFHLLLLFGLQQALLAIGAPLGVSIVVAEVVCAQEDDVIKTQILSASMLMCGVSTFVMSTFGVRLPIFQGPTSTYLIPLLAMASTPEFKCPVTFTGINAADNSSLVYAVVGNNSHVPARDIILTKISRLSGSLVLVGVIHFLIGVTGVVGIIIRYIGPVTIVPTIVLVGLHIFKVLVKFSEPSWLVATVTCVFNLTFSLFLSQRQTPLPWWSSRRGFHIFWYPLHRVFSVLISLILGWGLSAILTTAGVFTDDPGSKQYLARTDAKGDIIARTPWFDLPYPGKFGGYSFSTAGFVSFLVATLLSVLDSIGDYNASARTARVTPPPKFAFNRGIAAEGLTSLLGGSMGCCHATVSYGSNIGAMGITGVASRRVFQLCGIIYVLSAIIGKVGAFFITIPLPVLGGSSLVMTGMFIGMVLSYLETINLRSARNVAIIGIALLLGLMMPYWVKNNPNGIQTGSAQMDSLFNILLSNPSFVAGFFACVMDNTVPGTLKDRGLLDQIKELDGGSTSSLPEKQELYLEGREVYRLPFIPNSFRRSRVARIIPIFDLLDK